MAPAEVDVQGRRDDKPQSDASLGDSIVGLSRLAELALAQAGMSSAQYRLLLHVRTGHAIQSDLAFELAVTKQSVTRLVDGVVAKGFITRRVDEADRRRVIHAITLEGERALGHADEVIEQFLMAVLQDLDDAESEDARRGLELFGRAKAASFRRVGPDGIVPGRKRQRAAS